MNGNEARLRFEQARVGRLSTVTSDGLPHVVPVVFALVDDFLYTAVDSKPKTTTSLKRLANIASTGRASLLVDHYDEDWSTLWWVRVDGSAQVLADGRSAAVDGELAQVRVAVEALTNKYHQYLGQPLVGPVIAVHLTHWQWWDATPVVP